MSIFIELDKRRELKFTDDSLMKLAIILADRDINFLKLIQGALSKREVAKYIVWACLIDEDPSLTPEAVMDLLVIYFFKHRGSPEARQELEDRVIEAIEEFKQARKRIGQFN